MPKQIPELRERIVAAARRMLMGSGYQGLNMRTIARELGVASGTIYNYFDSKDQIVAAVTMEDWQAVLQRMDDFARDAHPFEPGLAGLCGILCDFTDRYQGVWASYDGGAGGAYTARYHAGLREQLARPIGHVLGSAGREDLLPLAPVLAESMLACALHQDLGVEKFGLLAAALANGTGPKEDQ